MSEGHVIMAPIVKREPVFVNCQSVPVLGCNRGMKLLGDRVRELREERGESRDLTARLAGIPKTTLQTLEDKPQARSGYLLELASHFGVEPRWLQDGKAPKWAAPGRTGNISHLPPHPLRLDPHMLREGFVMVSDLFEDHGGRFNEERDWDLVASAYEWARTDNQTLHHEIDRAVAGRVLERGVSHGATQGQVGDAAAGKRSRGGQRRAR